MNTCGYGIGTTSPSTAPSGGASFALLVLQVPLDGSNSSSFGPAGVHALPVHFSPPATNTSPTLGPLSSAIALCAARDSFIPAVGVNESPAGLNTSALAVVWREKWLSPPLPANATPPATSTCPCSGPLLISVIECSARAECIEAATGVHASATGSYSSAEVSDEPARFPVVAKPPLTSTSPASGPVTDAGSRATARASSRAAPIAAVAVKVAVAGSKISASGIEF